MKTLIILLLLCGSCFADPLYVSVIAYEASGEPFEGQVLVAKVIQNRMVERGLSADEVVCQRYQFSCVKNGKIDSSLKPRTSKELHVAAKAWEQAKWQDSGVNLYCRYDCWPSWRRSPLVRFVKRVGNHVFFEEVR